MKFILLLVTGVVLSSSHAMADWSQTFRSAYEEKGVDAAVTTALGEGIAPTSIVEFGISIEKLPRPELIKALFCALVQPATIYEAAEASKIAEVTVEEGYQLALQQCAAEMEEQVNAAPGNPFPAPAAGQGRPAQASPWSF